MRTLAVLIATLLLTACASTSVQSTRVPLPPSEYEIDYARIAAVERHARRYQSEVVWVRLPIRRVEAAAPGQY